MKIRLMCMFAFIALAVVAFGQPVPEPVIDQELMDKPITDWQLNLTSLMVLSMVLGRVLASIRKGGGIKGIFAGIWGGTNTPKA